MSVSKRVIFCFCWSLLAGINGFSQAVKSPYSTFGIGELYGSSLAQNQGTGGVGISQPQFWYLNNQNPALLAYNPLTIFQGGVIGEQRKLTDGTISSKSRGGNLNYLAIAFPIKPWKIATSIGLMPYSNVDYLYTRQEQIPNTLDTVDITEEGRGGLTYLYWSTGFKVHKNIALGIKASYIFGSITDIYQGLTNAENQTIPYFVGINESTYSKGFALGGGISYSKDSLFNDNYRFNAGLTYDFPSSLKSNREIELFRMSVLGGDTIESGLLSATKGKLEIPAALGAGISFGKDRKWSVGIDYNYKNWSAFKSINVDEEGLVAAWKVAFGGEYIPNFTSLTYLRRVTYRAGLSYEQLPFFANGNKVNDFGINFGFSLPTGRSSIDLAFKTGNRGTTADNKLKENYFKVYLGVTLNDQWFVKRKFD
jgi:hypothetical protein